MDTVYELSLGFIQYFLTFFLVVGLIVIFRKNSRIGLDKRKNVLLTVGSVLVLLIFDIFETYCAKYPELRIFRLIASVIGYWFRPLISFGFLSLITDFKQRRFKLLLLPAIINFLVFLTAFFSKIAFWFDEDYVFQRGPLGYTVFVVSFFYIGMIVLETFRTFKSGQRWRGGTVLTCAIGCTLAPILEACGCAHYILYPTMLISILLFYLYLYSEYLSRDVLTGLLKRDVFYQDVNRVKSHISGVIVADMNGLKTINDTKGHKAGDEALISVAKVIRGVENESVLAYRMGGDEFAFICLDKGEQCIEELIQNLKIKVSDLGLSLSAGFEMKKDGAEIDAILVEADKKMYSDKSKFYIEHHLDRRRTS